MRNDHLTEESKIPKAQAEICRRAAAGSRVHGLLEEVAKDVEEAVEQALLLDQIKRNALHVDQLHHHCTYRALECDINCLPLGHEEAQAKDSSRLKGLTP